MPWAVELFFGAVGVESSSCESEAGLAEVKLRSMGKRMDE